MALLPEAGAIPTATSVAGVRRRAPPAFRGWEKDEQPTGPVEEAPIADDLLAFADELKGTKPLQNAEQVGFFTNMRANIFRNAAEIGVGLLNVTGQDDWARDFRAWAQDKHGYEEQVSLDDIEKAWDDGRYLGVVKEVLAFSAEHGIGSLPWWVGAVNPATMAGTMASMTGLIAEERAKNNGREEIHLEDIKAAAPWAIAAVGMQKVGLGAVTGRGIGAARPAQSAAGVAGKAATTGAIVSAEEAAQEVVEELGATVGTEAGVSAERVKRAALGGALVGGPIGAAGGTVTGALDVRSAQQKAIPADEAQAIIEEQTAPASPPQTAVTRTLPSDPEPPSTAPAPTAVPADEAQAVAEAQTPAQAPELPPGVTEEELASVGTADDLASKARRGSQAVEQSLEDLRQGKFNVETLNGLKGTNLFDFGARVGLHAPNLSYPKYRDALTQYLKTTGALDTSVAPDTGVAPSEPIAQPVRGPAPAQILPQPDIGPVVPAAPAPAAPSAPAAPAAVAQGIPLAALRRRAGELGVDARGSRTAIQARLEARELEIAKEEARVEAATFAPLSGSVAALESRSPEEGYSVAESTLREGAETLRYLAAKPARDKGKGRKKTKAPSKTQEGAQAAVAKRAQRAAEDARTLELLHADLTMARSPEEQLAVLNRAAPILERHTKEVSTPGDDLVGKLRTIRSNLVQQRPVETRQAQRERDKPKAPAPKPAPTPQPTPVITRKRKVSKAEAVTQFVKAMAAVRASEEQAKSAAAVREEADTLADQLILTDTEGQRRLAPVLSESGASAEAVQELRTAAMRLRGMARSRQARAKILEQEKYVRELLTRVETEARTPPPTRERVTQEELQQHVVANAELDALIAEQAAEIETDLEGVIDQEVMRFTDEELAILSYQERQGNVSELPHTKSGPVIPSQQEVQGVLDVLQPLQVRQTYSAHELLGILSRALDRAPQVGNVPAMRRLATVLGGLRMHDASVQLVPGMGSRFGAYFHGDHVVHINSDLLQSDPVTFLHAAMHELVHAATARQLTRKSGLAKRLDEIRQYVDSLHIGTPNYHLLNTYGVLDTYEFLAEGLTNPIFQEELNNILLPVNLRTQGKLRSVWENLVDIVRRALGMKPREHSALDVLLRTASPMLTADSYSIANRLYRQRRTEQLPLGVMGEDGARVGYEPVTRHGASTLIDTPATTVRDRLPGVVTRNRLRAALYAIPRDALQKAFRRYFVDASGANILDELIGHIRDTAGTFHLRWSKEAGLIQQLNNQTGGKDKAKGRQMRNMYEMAVESTLGSVHPDKSWSHADNQNAVVTDERAQGREALHARLEKEWHSLPQDVQDSYHAMQRRLEGTYNDLRRETMRFFARSEGIDDAGALKRIAGMRRVEDLDAIVEDHGLTQHQANRIREAFDIYANRITGPYFPLRRMGDYVAYGTKKIKQTFKTDADALHYIDTVRNEYPGASVYQLAEDPLTVRGSIEFMSQVDSQHEAELVRKELADLGFSNASAGLKRELPIPADSSMHNILRVAEEKGHRPEVVEALREALMAMLPEARQLRASLRRNYVEGASTNMLQSFAQHLTASHRAIAHLQHSHEIQEAYKGAERLIKAKEASDPGTAVKMRMVINELERRQESVQEGKKVSRADSAYRLVGQIAFTRYLLDVSYLAINSTQTLFVTYPELAGKYGQRKATRALYNAYRDLTPRIRRSGKAGSWLNPSPLMDDVKRDIDSSSWLPASERKELKALFTRAQQQGVLNALQSEEMVAIGHGETRLDQLMRQLSGPAQYVEFMNRLVTLHAGYKLAREAGMSPEQSTHEAIENTRDTHFDYSIENRPRWSHRGVGQLVGVFKMYAMGMMTRIGEYSVKMTRPEARKEGTRQMLTMLAIFGAVAGLLGSIMAEPVRWALWMLGLVMDDEDNVTEFLDDPDLAIREWTHGVLGEENEQVAAWITDGLVPPLGTRIGLNAMMLRDTPDPTDTADDILVDTMTGIFGAPGAYVRDIAKGIGHIQEGKWGDAFAAMTPVKATANIERARQLATEGVTDRNGNVLVSEDEFGFWAVLGQAIGFTPGKKQQVYIARDVKYKRQKAAQQRAGALRQKYYQASREERQQVLEEIRGFNRNNPVERITVSSLRKGMQRRRKQEAQTVRGVYFHGRKAQQYYNPQTEFSTLP